MNTKLKWKQKWCDDKSGYWYSAKVPIINWEYIVEQRYNQDYYVAGVLYSKIDDDITFISKAKYKTVERATKSCETHLNAVYKKFKKWIQHK